MAAFREARKATLLNPEPPCPIRLLANFGRLMKILSTAFQSIVSFEKTAIGGRGTPSLLGEVDSGGISNNQLLVVGDWGVFSGASSDEQYLTNEH